ncbi:MAG: tRNA pseudouridine(55) synthase TruB [Planctomycetaceae bacterium]
MLGVLNLNKPPEVTSRDVVNVVQRIVKPTRVGHAGTLDPMATGVLLVCVGPATRLISLLQESPKTYVAEFRLGERSDTDDSTGSVEVAPPDAGPVSVQQLQSALSHFVGTINQVPPAYSAVKVKGQRAYAKARRGEDVQLRAKSVTVYSIDLLNYQWPALSLQIRCGSGTYIRSIARDLGTQLGCGGLMSALQRTAIGEFHVDNAVAANSLTAGNLESHLIDAIRIVSHLPQYRCSAEEREQLKTGRAIKVHPQQLQLNSEFRGTDSRVAFTSADGRTLLALGELQHDHQTIQPRAVLRT